MAKAIYHFGAGAADGDGSMKSLLGSKGANLAEMSRLGLPVPPGFTITTEHSPAFAEAGAVAPPSLEAAVDEALARLETARDARLGDAASPLVVSVRSGGPASMPGMMDTVLNLGINDETVVSLAKRTGDGRFAWDAYRRLVAMYGAVVLKVPREGLDAVLEAERRKAAKEAGIDASRMNAGELQRRLPDSALGEAALRSIVAELKATIEQHAGRPFPQAPREQLQGAIAAVFQSWHGDRARAYRELHGIDHSLGTACNVQAMVFGNLGEGSATGVAFTRDPSTGEHVLFGEWLPNAQGEDVVAGVRTPQPLRGKDASALEAAMPAVYAELAASMSKLEAHFRDMQDVEFTIESGKLYLLQTRSGKRAGRAAVKIAVDMAHEGLLTTQEAILHVDPSALEQLLHPSLDPKAATTLLATGLPASPGAASGHVVFSADEAERRSGQGRAVILVRSDTSPEDILGMKAARAILTARGGMTSHAAVVARGMGKPCVAGCSAVSVSEGERLMTITVYDADGHPSQTVTIKAGDLITVDGTTGSVYLGAVATVPAALSPEFHELMAWADAVRSLRVRANADTAGDARTARNFGAEGIGLCRTEHMFFEEDRISAMREMILAADTPARLHALAKLLPFQREDFVSVLREMDGLPVTIRLLDPPLHEFLPHDVAQLEHLALVMGVSVKHLERRYAELNEHNPMLGHRGCRLGVTFPEIYDMQAQAIFEAACDHAAPGSPTHVEIMIPLPMTGRELELMRRLVSDAAERVFAEKGRRVAYTFGTMIELPRAALGAADLARMSEFFSFGTNDLTQTTLGLSRDDAGKFMSGYLEAGIFAKNPFQSIDVEGVGELVRIAVERGRAANPALKLGICGEHAGDPASIAFFAEVGFDYVSCSAPRVPVARLAAAQAALRLGAASSKASD